MSANEIHVGDIGTILRVTITDTAAVDVSGATTKTIFLLKPSGTKLSKAAIFTTDGTDGKIQYTTVSGDLDEPVWWKIQAYVKLPGGEWYSDWQSFEVHDNL